MRQIPVILLLMLSGASHAGTPQEIGQAYADEAKVAASARRGEALFRQRFSQNDKMPGCTSCHTDNPLKAGEHVVTGKSIRPLAVSANADRFSDAAKVEKWFGRNCREVVGRACTPGEKADFVAFMSAVR